MISINPGEEITYDVQGAARRRLDVPLRHLAGAPPHRQRHVRDDDRGAQGRACEPGRPGVRLRPGRVVPRRPGRARLATPRRTRRRPGPRLRGLQRHRQPVPGQPDRDRDRQARPGLRPRRGARASTAPSTSWARSSTRSSRRASSSSAATTATGAPRPSTSRRRRARSSSSPMAEDGLYPFVTHAFNFVDPRRPRSVSGRRRRPAQLASHPVLSPAVAFPGRPPANLVSRHWVSAGARRGSPASSPRHIETSSVDRRPK